MPGFEIDANSSVPPYEQLRTQIARMVDDGTLEAGEKLPTVRRLAADLGLAVNTVARAFRELEGDGVITTRGRQGSFVRSDVADDQTSGSATREAAAAYTRAARAAGLTLAESVRLIEQSWGERRQR